MASLNKVTDAVFWFVNEVGARVVAESGFPNDRYHLGKLILRSLKDTPDFVMQIDAATGQSETYGSVLKRTVQCATSFKKLGLKAGDVIALMAPSHIDLAIPFYAALYLGLPIAALDENLGVLELETMFKITKPKLVFCQEERAPFIKEASMNIELDNTIITFNDSDHWTNFKYFMETYGQDADVASFKAADFDSDETIALLASTSGTTGLPKCASLTHKNLVLSVTYIW